LNLNKYRENRILFQFFARILFEKGNFYKFAELFKHSIDLWCSGSTADFGSVSLGSSPGRSTLNLLFFREGFFYALVFDYLRTKKLVDK
jgi:hypothetical protein